MVRLLCIGFWVITKGAMPTATFTAITTFVVVLRCKNPKAIFRPIKITFLNRNNLFHLQLHFNGIKLLYSVDNLNYIPLVLGIIEVEQPNNLLSALLATKSGNFITKTIWLYLCDRIPKVNL